MNHFSWPAWWSGQKKFLDQHPVAHPLGGAALYAGWRFLALPLVAKTFGVLIVSRGAAVLVSLALTGLVQALWELNQVEQWGDDADGDPNYPYESGFLDLVSAVVGAGLVAAVTR